MKSRLIVAAIGVPVLLIILIFAPAELLAIFLAIISVLAIYEILYTTALVKNRKVLVPAMVFAGLMPFWACYGHAYSVLMMLVFVYVIVLVTMMLTSKDDIAYKDVSAAFFASFFIPLFMSTLLILIQAENGRFWVFFPFIIAFTTDSGAFFAGKLVGKHKLAPGISPNKTIEGSIGGLCSAVIFMLIFGLFMEMAFGLYVRLLPIVLCAILGSIAGQFGDLVFSGIKRQAGLKDYGNLLPGHGGILDRFDSVIFVAPLVMIFLILYSPFL